MSDLYIGLVLTGVVAISWLVGIWYERTFNQKGWQDRAIRAEKSERDRLVGNLKDKLNEHPDAPEWMADRPRSLDAFAETHKWQREMEAKLKFGLFDDGLDPFRHEAQKIEASYKSNGIAPLKNYVEPKWSAKQVHDWQELTNKEFNRGDLDRFSCKICNDQKYIFVQHQIGTEQFESPDGKKYDMPVYGKKEDGSMYDTVPCECVKPKKGKKDKDGYPDMYTNDDKIIKE